MSDEIDDLSFPNAVITRLMNEAVSSEDAIFHSSIFPLL